MKRITISTALIMFATLQAITQMNFQDSSAKVNAYWHLGEKYEYSVNYQNLKYGNQDTTSNETMTYDVEVSVIDSTADGYTVRWFYKNFKSNSESPIVQKLATASEDIAVDIQLDELGSILGVLNWEEVRDYMSSSLDTLMTELPDMPELGNIVNKMKLMYATKETIEATAIHDAQQFHKLPWRKIHS